ncbi:hypothetical protein TWF706_005205 [Orbilia oligospora]|nr:hypothetical protein TWF706_005205 [Orbilia oligospora]
MAFVDSLIFVGEALVYALTWLATMLRGCVAQLRSPIAPLPSLAGTPSSPQTSTPTDERATAGWVGENTQRYDNTPCSLPGIDTFGPMVYELDASSRHYHNSSSGKVNSAYKSRESITLEMLLGPRDSGNS